MTASDRSLLLLPMYNLTSIRRVLLPPLVVGGSVVCVDPVRARALRRLARAAFADHYMASVATQIGDPGRLERRGRPMAHSLRFALSGGAPPPPGVQARLERALGVPVIQATG